MIKKAVILAGGLGKRLRTELKDIPKPMASIEGRPFLEYVICNLLRKQGITEIILCVHYMADKIVDYFGDGSDFGVHILYSKESHDTPLGTGGALKAVEKYIDDEPFLVMNGDSYAEINYNDLEVFNWQ